MKRCVGSVIPFVSSPCSDLLFWPARSICCGSRHCAQLIFSRLSPSLPISINVSSLE